MSDRDDFPAEGEPSASRFHIPQANRDLQSNWELDLAKNLEEYLLKISSGEVLSDQESSINFAEAALLLQGSVQVYSRKVEYLYSLVLAALEFLSQKRQDQQEKTSSQPDESESNAIVDDENEVSLGLDDVPVEPKNCLVREIDKEDTSNHFLKPPANLLVLEGDCLDGSGDAGELESYLLATCNFYRDFLLLDPSDAGAVYKFLKTNGAGQEQPALHKGTSVKSKHPRSSFASPIGKSGGTPYRSSFGKNQGVTLNGTSECNHAYENNNDNPWSEPPLDHDCPLDDMHHEEGPNFGVSNDGHDSDSDNDHPWKPLNPHEPGNLKIKPFKASKAFGRQVIHNSKQNITSQFPIAKVNGIISPELAESFEAKLRLQEKQNASQSPPYFEKLRRSFTNGEEETFDAFCGIDDENDVNGVGDFPDFDHPEFDLSNNTYDMDRELSQNSTKKDATANFDGTEAFPQDDPCSQASLEDLCRSHLNPVFHEMTKHIEIDCHFVRNAWTKKVVTFQFTPSSMQLADLLTKAVSSQDALLASIAENEKQTELATRVSTWKQRIEQALEEQDTRSPFDIHQYGEIVLDKLSLEAVSGGSMPFTDVVKGQAKHNVARTFSALLQLVNNGDVDLQRAPASNELICYTAENSFTVKLHSSRRKQEMGIGPSRKRVKSPSRNRCSSRANPSTSEVISPSKPSPQNGRLSVKLGKGTVIRCTPEGKRRRRSRLAEAVDLQPAR